ncbi:MAG: hypothetical protein HLUCCO18_08410 [Rhodobacteraceae bacterium HLUCCO18]|nr:MAG: hypothetical protein HLUCCO18_08410 [Rhodobacteraceae bacterium HLUCCO18]
MTPPTKTQNALAVLDLPGSQLAAAKRWCESLPSLSVPQLMVLAARLENSRSNLGRVRASLAGMPVPALDLIEQRLRVMWAAIEGELERRCGEGAHP